MCLSGLKTSLSVYLIYHSVLKGLTIDNVNYKLVKMEKGSSDSSYLNIQQPICWVRYIFVCVSVCGLKTAMRQCVCVCVGRGVKIILHIALVIKVLFLQFNHFVF